MTEQLHERVDADLRVGELGGIRVAQPVHESAGDGLRGGAGTFERPLDARLQRSPGDPFAVTPDEQRGPHGPSR